MKVLFGIASYNRPDKQNMLAYLKGMGFGREDIYIGTQCERDYDQYKKLFGRDATVVYRSGENVCDNKNSLLDTLVPKGLPVVLCSDKTKGIQILRGKKLHTVEDRESFDRILEFCFGTAAKCNAELWGVYPTNNAFYMKQSVSVDRMLLGCMQGFRAGTRLRFDRQFPIKEDFEISCRVIAMGGHTVRFNNLALNQTFHQKGGCYDLWNATGDSVNKMCTERMLRKFPRLVERHATRKNELRYIGKSKTITL